MSKLDRLAKSIFIPVAIGVVCTVCALLSARYANMEIGAKSLFVALLAGLALFLFATAIKDLYAKYKRGEEVYKTTPHDQREDPKASTSI